MKWNAKKLEMDFIQRIVDRAENERFIRSHEHMGILMDLEACHCNGCELDLEKLLAFPSFDFAHDIYGINKHLDRETGKLKNCFLPRCARPDKAWLKKYGHLVKEKANA